MPFDHTWGCSCDDSMLDDCRGRVSICLSFVNQFHLIMEIVHRTYIVFSYSMLNDCRDESACVLCEPMSFVHGNVYVMTPCMMTPRDESACVLC